jgi:hypothetical protein
MRTTCHFILLWIPYILLIGCNANKSSVAHFEYQGYGDSTLSVMYGQIFENVNGTQIPLSKVQINILNTNRETVSDNQGYFSLGFEEGNYNILISKKKYQSLLLKNYQSVSDRISKTKIILMAGEGEEAVQLRN